ncbi:MAG TPA: hypothetical protein VHO24_17275 [Opitutaceae bacterium]|nr:hypothetical protein [Opitutaceae bacterium]
MAVSHPWPAAAIIGLGYFFVLTVVVPLGWTKLHVSPVKRTPEGFWTIAGTAGLLFIAAGVILHLLRARWRSSPSSTPG